MAFVDLPLILKIQDVSVLVYLNPLTREEAIEWDSPIPKSVLEFLKSPLCRSDDLFLKSLPDICRLEAEIRHSSIISVDFEDLLGISILGLLNHSKAVEIQGLDFSKARSVRRLLTSSTKIYSQMKALADSKIPIVVTLPEGCQVYNVPQHHHQLAKHIIGSSSVSDDVASISKAIRDLQIPPPPAPSSVDLVAQPSDSSIAFSTVAVSLQDVQYCRSLLPHLAFLLASEETPTPLAIPDGLLYPDFSDYIERDRTGYSLHHFENSANTTLGAGLCMAGEAIHSPTITFIRPQLSHSGKTTTIAETDNLHCIDLERDQACRLRQSLGLDGRILPPSLRYFPFMALEWKVNPHRPQELQTDQRKGALVVMQAQAEWFRSYNQQLGHPHPWPCRFAFVLTASYNGRPDNGVLRFYSPTESTDTGPVKLYSHQLPITLVPKTPTELIGLIHALSTPVIECLQNVTPKIHCAGDSLPLPNSSHIETHEQNLSSSCYGRGMALLRVDGLEGHWVSKPYARHGAGIGKRWITNDHEEILSNLSDMDVFPHHHWYPKYGTLLTRYHHQVTPTAKHASRLLEVVRRVHIRGYLHGDLHEGNVLFHAEGGVKLVDLDFTRRIGERVVPPMNLQVGEKFFPRLDYLMPPAWNKGVPMCAVTKEFELWCALQLAKKVRGDPAARFDPETTYDALLAQVDLIQSEEPSQPITPKPSFI